MVSYQVFKEEIILKIQGNIRTDNYLQEMQLRVLHVADDLLRQRNSSSIEDYKKCIFEAIHLSQYPSFLIGLHEIVTKSYEEFMNKNVCENFI